MDELEHPTAVVALAKSNAARPSGRALPSRDGLGRAFRGTAAPQNGQALSTARMCRAHDSQGCRYKCEGGLTQGEFPVQARSVAVSVQHGSALAAAQHSLV